MHSIETLKGPSGQIRSIGIINWKGQGLVINRYMFKILIFILNFYSEFKVLSRYKNASNPVILGRTAGICAKAVLFSDKLCFEVGLCCAKRAGRQAYAPLRRIFS